MSEPSKYNRQRLLRQIERERKERERPARPLSFEMKPGRVDGSANYMTVNLPLAEERGSLES